MFTQCTNCQAIFSVNMREITVSKGYLRCGECHAIFDSSKSLSTTMQAPFVAQTAKAIAKENLQTMSSLDDWQSNSSKNSENEQIDLRQSLTAEPVTKKSKVKQPEYPNSKLFKTKGSEKALHKNKRRRKVGSISAKWPSVAAGLLGLLFVLQVAFNYRHLFLDTLKYEPEKIQMLNHNVFAHPIEKEVLLISASIENTADFDQAFPTLEVRLTNSKTELVALRRFSPEEYLDNYSASTLLLKKRPTSIKLKIQDPGNQATRFQFSFL